MARFRRLGNRYYNVPASLADVCLVRTAEIYDRCPVLSLDSDFHIYRRHGRKTKVWATVREWKVHFENSGVPDEQIEKVARAFRHLDDISSADVRKLLP